MTNRPILGALAGSAAALSVALVLQACSGCTTTATSGNVAIAPSAQIALEASVPIPLKPGTFAGKFELVPLFDKGNQPVIRNGHQYYALRDTIAFKMANGDVVATFAGARTDLASIPAAIWGLMPPDGPWSEGATLHDACYRTRGDFKFYAHTGLSRAAPYTRAECDEVLRQTMVSLRVPAAKRIAIFSAVRAFGGKGFGH